jgi:hypothetical protein
MNVEDENTQTDDKLMAEAARLQTEIAPERDLWPDIEAAIAEPQRQSKRWTPYFAQAAAVVLLVGASSTITYKMTKDDNDVSPVIATMDLDSEFTSFGNNFELGQGFQDARSNLATQLDIELDRLAPEARTGVEENLAVIRDAITEINSALEQEPDNVLLQELLLRTYREELTVMRKVGGLTQRVMSRNDI